MTATNDSPFRAGFGKSPPLLAGRDDVLDEFSAALSESTWSPARTVLVEGVRGVGKTVLLNAFEDIARERGWIVISETATPGFLGRITTSHLPRAIDHFDPPPTRRLIGGEVAGVGLTTEVVPPPRYPETLRSRLERLATLIQPRGVLFTLDEVNATAIGELVDFAAEHQHAVRNDLEVAFAAAGLSAAIKDVLRHKSLTFLRRAERPRIEFLSYDDAVDALRVPIVDRGRSIGWEALDYAVRATQGYPFLAQLIGDLAWKASPDHADISLDDVKAAYRRARRTMSRNVHEPAVHDLSPTDMRVLMLIAESDGPVEVNALRTALGVNAQYLNVYRQRLIDAGLVVATGRGRVDLAMPYLREYLRERGESDAASATTRSRWSFPPPPELDD